MIRKNIPINYIGKDFSSIKENLVNHAKRYYPDSFKDFNEARIWVFNVGYGCLYSEMFFRFIRIIKLMKVF